MTQVSTTIYFYAYISGAWVLLLDTQPANASRGFSDNSPENRLADPSELTLSLNNNTGIYTPDGLSALAGWKKGLPIKMEMTFEGETWVKSRGVIDDIQLPRSGTDKKVHLTCLDWFDYAAKYPIVNPALLEDKSAEYAIDTLLNSMPVPPQGRALSVGQSVYPTIFDTVKGNTSQYTSSSRTRRANNCVY